MCGRYSLTRSLEEIAGHFQARLAGMNFGPRFNVAPTQTLPVAVAGDAGVELRGMRWGLVPAWAKEESIGNRMINARAETVAEKPSFRSSFKMKRCLVPCDGFYEWVAGKTARRRTTSTAGTTACSPSRACGRNGKAARARSIPSLSSQRKPTIF